MKKRTTNRYQDAYMIAKARVKAIESQEAEIEKKYIANNGIVNKDGSIPERICCIIDDDAAFEKANEECSALIVAAGLEAELNTARDALKTAEDRLIEYGLSLAPAKVRETLREAVKKDYSTRKKVLNLAFRLDVSTVPV